MYKDFRSLCDTATTQNHYNLLKVERQALKDLAINKEVIIKQADKEGSLVLQNREDYFKEAHLCLSVITWVELKTLVYDAWRDGVLDKKER